MFPNVRLLIGALFITVLVLSGEFGVFAALRVNREPLSRLTSQSAPLQFAAGKNAPRAVPVSWSAPLNAPAPAGNTQTGNATAELSAADAVEHKAEALAPSNDGAVDTLKNDNQVGPAVLQTALAPSPAAPVPAAPVAEEATPIAQAPIPPANTAAPANEAAPADPDASGAPAQQRPAAAVGTAAGNNPPEQTAAAPAAIAAVPEQQTPAAEVVKPAGAEPPQAAPAPQPHETAAQPSEQPASSAPAIAAIAPAAAEPPAAEPAEITGSVPNAAIPEETAAPKVEAPHAKPSPKIVHKPAAKNPRKTARAPAPARHAVKKRIARRNRAPAAASSAQTANTFDNPVFQSAPAFQRQTRSRAGAKHTATNNGFSNTFGARFTPQ